MTDFKEKFKELTDVRAFYQAWSQKVHDGMSARDVLNIEQKLVEAQENAPAYTAAEHHAYRMLTFNGPGNDFKEAANLTEKFLRYADYNLGIFMDNAPEQAVKDAVPAASDTVRPLAQKYQLPNLQQLLS